MKKKLTILIICILIVTAYADPNSIVSVVYKKLDSQTVERTEVTVYIKSVLETERASIVAKRDALKARIDMKYQPMIDDIDEKLELFK